VFKLAELFVQITGDDRPLNRSLGLVQKNLGLLDGRLTRLGATLGGAGLVAGLTAAAGAMVAATAAAVTAEKRLAALGKAADLDAGPLLAMRDDLRALAVELEAVPFEALLDIAVAGSKLGVANDDLVEYTRGIAKLSTALDDIPAGEIADQVGKMNAVFQLGVRGAQQIGSAVDKLADSSVASADGILAVSQRISGTAAASRLAAPDAIALATALLETGTRAEQAGSTLNRLLVGLDLAGRLGNDSAAGVQAFLASLQQLDTRGRVSALAAIGLQGTEDVSEIQKLVAQVGRLAEFSALAREEFTTLNQINKSFATQSALTESRVTNLKNQFDFMADDLGTKLIPVLEELVALGLDINAAFEDAFDAGAIETFAAALKEVVTTGRGLVGMFGGGNATANLGRSFASGALNLFETFAPGGGLFGPINEQVRAILEEQMIDSAARALDRPARPALAPGPGGRPGGGLVPPIPLPARPVPTRVGPAPFDPALGGIAAGNVAGALNAVLMGLRADEVAKAQAAQEFATRQAAERRERQGVGQTVGIGDLARELQQKALGGPTAAEKQLRTLEDARELQRMAADRLRELVEQGKRPQMGPGFAT
jgi:TP901 family phage tail tape measure protein